MSRLNEALLEMYFHPALVDLFSSVYGGRFLRLLKPSKREEAWVGFDQGWTRTHVSHDDLMEDLRRAIHAQDKSATRLHFGYFLQFKVVKRMEQRSSLMPSGFHTPYYRAELSVKPSSTTGISQHETLIRLDDETRSDVSYCCPMVFDPDDVFEEPDLDRLRIVPIDEAPENWLTNTRHFIVFQNPSDSNPVWHSEPVPGKALKPEQWVGPGEEYGPRPMEGPELAEWLTSLRSQLAEIAGRDQVWYPHSLSILEVGENSA